MLSNLNNINKNLRNNKKNNKKKKEDKFTYVELLLSLLFVLFFLTIGFITWLEENKKQELKLIEKKYNKEIKLTSF